LLQRFACGAFVCDTEPAVLTPCAVWGAVCTEKEFP
jgi:hypothetical protein